MAEKFVNVEEIAKLREQNATKRAKIESQMRQFQDDLRALDVEDAVLTRLEKTAAHRPHTNGKRPAKKSPPPKPARSVWSPTAPAPTQRPALMQPKLAVVKLLKESGPMEQKELVDRLQHVVDAGKHGVPRKAVTNAIWWMKKRGQAQEHDGRLQLNPNYVHPSVGGQK